MADLMFYGEKGAEAILNLDSVKSFIPVIHEGKYTGQYMLTCIDGTNQLIQKDDAKVFLEAMRESKEAKLSLWNLYPAMNGV